jgi:hypothetical protein
MAEAVYVLCALTSILAAVLLLRGYRSSGTRLLFWSSLCFGGLALQNILLLVDLLIVPDVDLSLWRTSVGLGALMILLYGLVREPQ